MPRFSANLSMMFTELPFEERFAAAAKAGFKAVEFMYPYEYPKEKIADLLRQNKLEQVLFNLPAGNWDGGERGTAVLDDSREEEFKAGVVKGLDYAVALGCPRMNCLVGIAKEPDAVVLPRLVKRLAWAADQFAAKGKTMVLEFLNGKDMPGFYLKNTPQVVELIGKVGRPNLKIQYDVYHSQRVEGDLLNTMRANLALIDHIQISDNPGRTQPGLGEINYVAVLNGLDEMGYKGWVGLEYTPVPDTLASLSWFSKLGFSL